jgi:hypothetical protein
MARGDFIFVSHGDDVMMPQMVEEMVGVWLLEKVSLVTANAFYIDENSNLLNSTRCDPDGPADDSFETVCIFAGRRTIHAEARCSITACTAATR